MATPMLEKTVERVEKTVETILMEAKPNVDLAGRYNETYQLDATSIAMLCDLIGGWKLRNSDGKLERTQPPIV
jgi:hypothetical protein